MGFLDGEIRIVSGRIVTLGDGISTMVGGRSIKRCSYIEMNNGEHIRNVSYMDGISTKVNQAVERGESVTLHLAVSRKVTALLAITMGDGQVFASDFPTTVMSRAIYMWAMLVPVAILTVIILGAAAKHSILIIGLLFPGWLARHLLQMIKIVRISRSYVSALRGAILL